jgi:WW domain-binding protein 11
LCLFQGKSNKVSAHYTKFVKEDYPFIRILKGLDAKKARADRNEGSEDSDESSGSDDDSDDDSDNELLPELPVFKGEDLIEEEEAMKAKQIEEKVNQQHDETIEDAQQDAQVDAQEDIPMPEAESEAVPGSEVMPKSEADEEEEEDSDIESIPMPKGPPPRKPFERQIPQEYQQQRLSRPPPPPPPGGPGRHYRPPPPNAYRPGPGGYRPPPPPPSKSMLNWYHNPFLFACEMFILFFFVNLQGPLHMQHQQHGPIPHYAAAATPQHYMAAVPAAPSREFSGMADSVTTVEGSTVVESSETPPTAAVTISAAPQVRDLQKELVGFVPAAVRKKRLQAGKKGTIPKVARPTINAAPDMDLGDTDELAPSSSIQLPTPSANNNKQGDEYERFMREMQGIL